MRSEFVTDGLPSSAWFAETATSRSPLSAARSAAGHPGSVWPPRDRSAAYKHTLELLCMAFEGGCCMAVLHLHAGIGNMHDESDEGTSQSNSNRCNRHGTADNPSHPLSNTVDRLSYSEHAQHATHQHRSSLHLLPCILWAMQKALQCQHSLHSFSKEISVSTPRLVRLERGQLVIEGHLRSTLLTPTGSQQNKNSQH